MMKEVKFLSVNKQDTSDYLFTDKNDLQYHLFNDARGRDVKNVTADFWDKFFFCEKIFVEYTRQDSINVINKIVSYKIRAQR